MSIPSRVIRLPPTSPPILSVVIHTEEEFDWSAPHDRAATGVAHMQHIGRAQTLFERFGIVPNYVIGYPIATQEVGYRLLKAYADDGKALIGAHLHPWVCPPYREEVNARNSYPGNLPAALERDKLRTLTEAIAHTFGRRPQTYLAGRYGNGPNSLQILRELGYRVDISVAPPIDYSADGGPDYSGWTCNPFWFGDDRALLVLPGAGGYAGLLRRGGTPFYRRLQHPALRRLRVPGMLSRAGLFERSRLSPEDYPLPELKRLTRDLIADGVRCLVFSFHSPSIAPGCTPYVKTQADLETFLGRCEAYFEYFFGALGGRTLDPLALKAHLDDVAEHRP
ncbi:MAG TPA: polysaccharide deacetylase family protein [Rhodocyclaceae bacterium]|nr:polysaccharide deacetylase family protein [Rhodocyclaceae bacterium]